MMNLIFRFKKTIILKALMFFMICVALFLYTSWCSARAENEKVSYQITLPQKVAGIEKLEYIINDTPKGSTSGVKFLELEKDTSIQFLVKFESSGYSKLLCKNVIIKTNSGSENPLKLNVYRYDRNQNLVKRPVAKNELIDPTQTYVTDTYTVARGESFKIEGVEIDKYSTIIKSENIDASIDETLNVMYSYENEAPAQAKFDGDSNSYIIENVPTNTALKFWLNLNLAYSQSKVGVTNNGNFVNKNTVGKNWTIPTVSNNTLILSGIEKNRYDLCFNAPELNKFKYKKEESLGEFTVLSQNKVTVIHGENFVFTYENNLNDQEITVDNVVIRPETDGYYHLRDVEQKLNIAVKPANKSLYSISLPSETDVVIKDLSNNQISSAKVNYGSEFKFKMEPSAAYTQNAGIIEIYAVPYSKLTKGNYDVSSNLEESRNYILKPDLNGVYTVFSVKDPLAIFAKNLIKNTYLVSLPEHTTHADFAPGDIGNAELIDRNTYKVKHGDSIAFTGKAHAGYTLDEVNFASPSGNIDVARSENQYVLQNVTKDTNVVAQNIVVAKYNVSLEGVGVLYKTGQYFIDPVSNTKIEHQSGEFEFKVYVVEGYKLTNSEAGIKLRVEPNIGNFTVPENSEGTYKITGITQDIKIITTGVEIMTSTIKLPVDSPDVEFISTITGEILPAENMVQYGDDLEFKVVEKPGGNIGNFKVRNALFEEIQPVAESNGTLTYSIMGITPSMGITAVSSRAIQLDLSDEEPGLNMRYYDENSGTLIAAQKDSPDNTSYFVTAEDNVVRLRLNVEEQNYALSLPHSSQNLDHAWSARATGSPSWLIKTNSKFIRSFKDLSGSSGYRSGGYFEIPLDVNDDLIKSTYSGIQHTPFSKTVNLHFSHDSGYPIKIVDEIGNPRQNNIHCITTDRLADSANSSNVRRIFSIIPNDQAAFPYGTALNSSNFIIRDYPPTGTGSGAIISDVTVQPRYLGDEAMFGLRVSGPVSKYEGKDLYIEIVNLDWHSLVPVDFFVGEDLGSTAGPITDFLTIYDKNGNKASFSNSGLSQTLYFPSSESTSASANILRFKPVPTQYGHEIKDSSSFKFFDSWWWERGEKVPVDAVVSGPFNDGYYVINLTKPTTIVVTPPTKKIYSVKLPAEHDSPGVRFTDPLSKIEIDRNATHTREFDGTFNFNIELYEGYTFNGTQPRVTVFPPGNADVERYHPSGGGMFIGQNLAWRISNFRGDVQIIVDGVELKRHTVKFEGIGEGANGFDLFDLNGTQFVNQLITHGGNFDFTARLKTGYEAIMYQNGYHLYLCNDDGEIIGTNNFPPPDNNYVASESGKTPGYVRSPSPNDTELNRSRSIYFPGGGVGVEDFSDRFQLTNVTQNLIIKVVGITKKQYDIFFTSEKGIGYYDRSGQRIEQSLVKANYGDDYSFSIKTEEGIDISNIVVTANFQRLELSQGFYTIKNITGPVNVLVDNVKKTGLHVRFDQTPGVTFKNFNSADLPTEVPISYGDDFSFRVLLDSNYSQSREDLEVGYTNHVTGEYTKIDRTNPPGNEDKYYYDAIRDLYVIKSVATNITIKVKDMLENSYKLTFWPSTPAGAASYYNREGTEKLTEIVNVSHNRSFSFKIIEGDGYDIENLAVYAQAQGLTAGEKVQLRAVDNVYTISNITSDYNIVAENVIKKIYKVEFRLPAGVHCVDHSGNLISNVSNVNHGETLTFKLSLDQAYNESAPKVFIKGTNEELRPNLGTNNEYTLGGTTGVINNTLIEVMDIKKNTYKINFVATEGVEYRNNKNKPFTGQLEVDYGDTLYFIVSILPAYDRSFPVVLLNDEKTLAQNAGVYELWNIREDSSVSVKQVVKNPENLTVGDVSKIPSEITTQSDVDAVVKATKAYLSLSDEEKKLVTNISELRKAQDQAGKINRRAGDIVVDGIDWYIKLIVTSLTGDEEAVKSFSEKADKKSVLSLYEMKLWDTLNDKIHEIPYGKKIAVTLPAPDLTEYKNPVVAHENSSGGFYYLDLSIVGQSAKFETSSFNLFGIVAKKVPNYVENPSDITLSISSQIKDEEELKNLLGEGLVSQLGDLTGEDYGTGGGNNTGGGIWGSGNNVSSGDATDSTSSAQSSGIAGFINRIGIGKAYNWALENELISVLIILAVGSGLIAAIILISRRKFKK